MASSSGPDPTQYLDITLLSDPVAESVSLQDAVQHLASIGVRVERFTRDSIHAMRMSVPAYVKEIRILGNISDRELLKNVMLQGVKNNVLSLPEDVTPQMVLSFARWLKRGAGARVLADQQHLLKINKKAVGDSTPDIVAFAHLLDQQVQDLTNAKKRVQHSSQVRIDELRKQIAIEEHNLRRDLAATARQFTPANDYAPPSKAALDNECWELYCARARDAGRALPPWNAILQEQATTALSNEVINKHRQDFCKIPSNQRLLQTWAASKIQDLRTNQEFRRVTEFERFLALASGDTSMASSSAPEAEMGQHDSGGEGGESEEEEREHTAAEHARGGPSEQPDAEGDQEQTPARKKRRSKRLRNFPSRHQRSHSGSKKHRKKPNRRDSDGQE
ncbi:ORF1p [Allium cepa amalgavirus 2]|uniref:ORF1p n=1 Tax=Allium cepa amalgavirus 2 TaxID=2058779 RepID=A0A2H5MGY3_9VIRU|nr:ORF1p [Allium cepa amalgavirus 2]UMM62370.1 ORF1p [Allium cepa amalgavirus 2]DAB41440.1 TPA_inf: ORF1p [Allium cepa amalgavirus 2]DBA07012.1 TPA_asm: putative nucleoprotein [Allium cepa amalgavirus 2]DBA07014.1 TPA_asm: putative nucleoprotein [Allium cepa amalgavirus 2]DBA07016.1 TPA_asm: putative nucleoprotein [Allium cepa amalgavirus 2]